MLNADKDEFEMLRRQSQREAWADKHRLKQEHASANRGGIETN